jgi:peptidoglycan/LPS O-acetylase OafA/YrhL
MPSSSSVESIHQGMVGTGGRWMLPIQMHCGSLWPLWLMLRRRLFLLLVLFLLALQLFHNLLLFMLVLLLE